MKQGVLLFHKMTFNSDRISFYYLTFATYLSPVVELGKQDREIYQKYTPKHFDRFSMVC